jgi:hypothetical protein
MLRHFTLEYWVDDDWYVGRLKEVPGVFSQGESLDELERISLNLIVEAEISHQTNHGADGTVEFSREITIPPNFTAECTENAEALENPSVDWNTLKLCALGDLRVDKSLVFKTVPFYVFNLRHGFTRI